MRIQTNIVFLYADSMRRDLSTCYIVQDALKQHGYRSIICSRRNFRRYLSLVLPQKLFIVGQVDMFHQDFIQAAAKSEQTEIYFMPAEGFASDSEYQNMYPVDLDYRFINSIFFWGENSLRWFKTFREVENPPLLKRAGYTRLPIAREYRSIIRRDDKKIGFIGRFPALNDIYSRNLMTFFVSDLTSFERTKLMARQESEARAINCYIDLFQFLIEKTDCTISLRPHPNEDIRTYRELIQKFGERFQIDNVFDVAEWMASCRVVVGAASSSFIDAHEVRTPVICLDKCLNSMGSTLLFDPALECMYESCYLPENMGDVRSLLIDRQLKPVSSGKFKNLIAADFCGDSELVFDTVVAEIIKKRCVGKWFDFALFPLLVTADFLLASLHRFRRNNALQFDFSAYYHPISKRLRNVSTVIGGKVRLALRRSLPSISKTS